MSGFSFSDVSGEMPDSYSPTYVEAAWYAWWEKQVGQRNATWKYASKLRESRKETKALFSVSCRIFSSQSMG